MPPPKDVVKIAIQMVGAIPQLIELQQTKPLASVLKDVCDAWSLPNAERYALQYADGRQTYITESNRGEIKNGSILRLTTSPDQEAERLYSGIQSNNSDVKTDSLKKLASLSQDVTFAQEFINRNGLKQIFYIVEEGNDTGEMLAHTLKAFMELMEHDFVSWETLSAAFIKKIVSYVNINAVDASVQQLSLSILENMVPTSRLLFELVKKEVTLDRLLTHLQVTNAQLQLKAMALLIALLLAATDAERRDMMDYLREKNIRQFIHKNIIHSSEPLGDEMAHYLYVLQSISLNLCERRMRTSMDPYSQEQRELLQSLRQTAFESESEAPASNFSTERRRSLCAKEFRKLGFMNNSNPAEDLRRAPPGLLALDNMVYFSRHTPNAYSRFILENSSREDKHECPFARSSIQLTLILCEILHVGEPCSETAQAFYPMFFGQDHFFEELFCICIQLVNKTWKEMRATQEDFDKVLQVVREQITRTLSLKPTSLELFKTRVNALNYSEILKLRQTERLHQEETLAVPVLELRERLKPELLELIRQQRLLHLCEGTLFRKISSRRRQDKLWYCRLSPNHKVLHYGDVEEGVHSPPIESLPEKSSSCGGHEDAACGEGVSAHEGEGLREAEQGRPGAGLLHRVRHGGILPQLHCPQPVRVLPLDGWAERAPGQGDDERANADGPRCPAVHGAQAAAPGPGEHQHSRHSPSHPKAPQQLKLLLRLQPRRAVSSSLCPGPLLHPPKIKPLPPGSVPHLCPKGTSPGAGWGLGHVLPAPCPSRGELPTLPCLCPAFLREHGPEPPSVRLLFEAG